MGDLLPFERPEDTSDWEETPNAIRLLREKREREAQARANGSEPRHPESDTPLDVLLESAENVMILGDSVDLTNGLEAVHGGWIIRRTDEYVIDVVRQLFNWRLHVATPDGYGQWYEHGYCYFGTGPDSLVLAIRAGQQWENPLHTDPIGFGKKAF